jgi:hypothetical protein
MRPDQDFLLYPLDTGEDPSCLSCGAIMTLAAREAQEGKQGFMTFRCEKCGRTEKFIVDE